MSNTADCLTWDDEADVVILGVVRLPERAQVLQTAVAPIPPLYEASELGSLVAPCTERQLSG